jgi:hypothetical protein
MGPELTATLAALSASTHVPIQPLQLSTPEWDPRAVDGGNDSAIVRHIRERYQDVHQFSCYPIAPSLFMHTPFPPGILRASEPPAEPAPKRSRQNKRRNSSEAQAAAAADDDDDEPFLHPLSSLRSQWQTMMGSHLYTPFPKTRYFNDGVEGSHLGIFGPDVNPLDSVIRHSVEHSDKPFFLHYVMAVVLQYYAIKKGCFMHLRTDASAAGYSELYPPWILVLVRGVDCVTPSDRRDSLDESVQQQQQQQQRAKAASKKKTTATKKKRSRNSTEEEEEAQEPGPRKARGRPPIARREFRECETILDDDNVVEMLEQHSFPVFLLLVFRWIESFSEGARALLHRGSTDAPLSLATHLHDNLAATLSVNSHFRELISPQFVEALQRDYHFHTRLVPTVCLEDSVVTVASSAKATARKNNKKAGGAAAAPAAADELDASTQIKLLQLQLDYIPLSQSDRLPVILCHQTFSPRTPIATGTDMSSLYPALFFIPKCDTVRRAKLKGSILEASLARQVKSRDSYTFFIDPTGVARVTIPRLMVTAGAFKPGELPVDDLSVAAMSSESWQWCTRNGTSYLNGIHAFQEQRKEGTWKLVTMSSVVMGHAATQEQEDAEAEDLDRQVKQHHSSQFHFFSRVSPTSNLAWIYKREQPLNCWQKELIIRAASVNHDVHNSVGNRLSPYWLMRAIQFITGREEDGVVTVSDKGFSQSALIRHEQVAMRSVQDDIEHDPAYVDLANAALWDLCETPSVNIPPSSTHSRRWNALFPPSQILLISTNGVRPWNKVLQPCSLCPKLDMAFAAASNLFAYNDSVRAELDQLSLEQIPSSKVAALRAIATFFLDKPDHEPARRALLGKIGMPVMKSNSMQSPLDAMERIAQCEKGQRGFVTPQTMDYCCRRIAESVPDTNMAIAICNKFREQHCIPLPSVSPDYAAAAAMPPLFGSGRLFSTPPLRPSDSRLHTPPRSGEGAAASSRNNSSSGAMINEPSIFAPTPPGHAAESASFLIPRLSDQSFHSSQGRKLQQLIQHQQSPS